MSTVIKVEGLSVSFATPRGELKAVRDVSIELQEGESLGVVGDLGGHKLRRQAAVRCGANTRSLGVAAQLMQLLKVLMAAL